VLVDLSRQRQGIRFHNRNAPDQRTRACVFAVSRAAGIIPDTSATTNSVRLPGKVNNVKVVATQITEGSVESLHLVAHRLFHLPGVECLLDLSCGCLLRFKLGLADEFRSQLPKAESMIAYIRQMA